MCRGSHHLWCTSIRQGRSKTCVRKFCGRSSLVDLGCQQILGKLVLLWLCSVESRACIFWAGPKPNPFLQNSICMPVNDFSTGNIVVQCISMYFRQLSKIGSLICYYLAGFRNVHLVTQGSKPWKDLQLSIPRIRAVPVCVVLYRLCTSLCFARLALRVVFGTFQDYFYWIFF